MGRNEDAYDRTGDGGEKAKNREDQANRCHRALRRSTLSEEADEAKDESEKMNPRIEVM